MTHLVDQSIHRIRTFLEEKEIAKSRLAVMAGVPEGCTRGVYNSDWNPTLDTLRKLERVIPEDFQPTKKSKKTTTKN